MSKEYDKYLKEHKENVAKGFYWLNENIPELLTSNFELQICSKHDLSKYNQYEYYAYDNYFYGKDQSFNAKKEFDLAWLKHIHGNPHHWQYWILNNDNGSETLIDMPFWYILEMICDWWSFCWKDGNLFGIFDWFDKNKSNMKLSVDTRRQVEFILGKINDKLTE